MAGKACITFVQLIRPIITTSIIKSFAVMMGILVMASAHAAEQLYRCSVNGETVFTDRPCADKSGASTKKSIELDYSTPYGKWHGQAQYQASLKGKAINEAHAVVPITLEIEAQGRLHGSSNENGCQMLGVASPSTIPTLLNLDVTFSGCRYSDYNRRYTGTLGLYKSGNYVQLNLRKIPSVMANPLKSFDIKATMRR